MCKEIKTEIIDVDEIDSDIECLGENTDKVNPNLFPARASWTLANVITDAQKKRPRSPVDASVSTFPNKRRATGSTHSKSNSPWPSTSTSGKRKEDAIVVDSEEDEVAPAPKKQRLSTFSGPSVHCKSEYEASASFSSSEAMPNATRSKDEDEEDWTNHMAALDLNDSTNWYSLPSREAIAPVNIASEESDHDEPLPLPRSTVWGSHHGSRGPLNKMVGQMATITLDDVKGKRMRMNDKSSSPRINRTKVWDLLKLDVARPPVRTRRRAFPALGATFGRVHTRELYYDLGFFTTRRRTDPCHEISGSVTKIVQSPQVVVACASAVGGDPDDTDSDNEEPVSVYNTEAGSALTAWKEGKLRRLKEHWRSRRTVTQEPAKKFYSVNDVAFCPDSASEFVSSGNDCVINLWGIREGEFECVNAVATEKAPLDLRFKPGERTLAVAISDGTVSIFSSFEATTNKADWKFRVSHWSCKSPQAAGVMAWGAHSTSNLLFASTEPFADDEFIGWHRAYDIHAQKTVIKLKVDDAGDDMAIDPTGERLALITRAEDGSHPLRVFDISDISVKPVEQLNLRAFENNHAEVRHACYSPDGVFLALARSDNSADVYDSRMFGRGPLYTLRHEPGVHCDDQLYGVQRVHWLMGRDGRRTGLMTGGDDGCVRLWDLGLAMDDQHQGRVLAQTDWGIGDFSVGDPYNDEHRLVVGDCGGWIHTYDFEDGVF